jgi:hypothetical protein
MIMKKVTKLSYLAMTILLVSCNEKVSPELLQSNNTAPATVAVPPEEYYFSVTNSSPVMQGYKLHKTGPGNKSAPCEVRNTTGLSNEIFAGDQTANDITCFFEAEELTLLHGGFSFDIGASKNTCDYVGYSPFGFYDRIPGNSTASYNYVTCTDISNTLSGTVASELGFNTSNSNGPAECFDYFIDGSITAPGTRERFTIGNELELCRFNYEDGPSCDIGKITINEYAITYDAGDPNAIPAVLPDWKTTKSTRVINCGGKIPNCVSGPVAEMKSGVSKFTEVTNTNLNQEFKKTHTYDGIQGKYYSVKNYTNYRRDLASKNIDFMNSYSLPAAYTGIWLTSFGLNRIFDPQVMDFYSYNKKLDGTSLITDTGSTLTPDITTASYTDKRFRARPLAADPFLGLVAPVNPFYTFYCYDDAFDVKARIRMVVREWDRIFPTDSSDLELLSDLGKGQFARMDSTVEYEVPGDTDQWLLMNDIQDWDDHIPMERTPGVFNASSTLWHPVATPLYPFGFFDSIYFTNGLDKQD